MKKIVATFVLALFVLVFAPLAEAQAGKVWRIGLLGHGPPSSYVAKFNAFRKELRARGYVEGQSIRYEYRYAGGKRDRLPTLAAELVQLKVDVIVATSTPTTRAAMEAAPNIPIVMNAGSPVLSGLVSSLARPGGNVTGVTIFSGPEFYSKRLELLKEIDPSASRVAILWTPANSAHRASMKALQAAAPRLGVTLLPIRTDGASDIAITLAKLKKERPDALLAFGYGTKGMYRKRILDFAVKNRIPAIWPNTRWMRSGGLMAYTVDPADNARRKAIYVDKILKGAKPADLPVQRPTKFDLIINLKTAKALGITIPPELLFRATKVIK